MTIFLGARATGRTTVIERILTHLGLDPQPPPRGRAREAGPHFAA